MGGDGIALAETRVADTRSRGPSAGPRAAPSGLGRFHVLERLGAGGMGIVYAAYDPELDRAVAIKRVRVGHGDRDAALAEARALARLSHPNVVPVYDVGVDGDHVHIVMELVRGQSLRAWTPGRAQADILAAYQQVGAGLAVAHAAGLVHRDVKPDNALIGVDGRVRIVDFGIAGAIEDEDRAADARPIAGTPRYMAPEQARGAPPTPAADQYAFSVALDEALATTGAPPARWIRAVLDRGRAPDPAQRFSSMTELLRALDRDPVRRRRRRIAVTVAGLIAVGAFAAGRAGSSDDDVCGGGAGELATAWSPDARVSALGRIAGLGPDGAAVAPRLAQIAGDHDRRWVAQHRAACQAHRQGSQSVVLFDRRTACLARGRAALTAFGSLVASATEATLPGLVEAAHALPDPDRCGDLSALTAEVAPPAPAQVAHVAAIRDRLARARVLIAGGRYVDARDLATGAVDDARTARHPPALAEALLVRGIVLRKLEASDASLAALAEATALGFEIGDDGIAVEAWARRAAIEGLRSSPGALDGLELVEAVARRPTTSPFARALLYSRLGNIELAREHRDAARAAFARALDEARTVRGPGAVEMLWIRANLALVTDDADRRDDLFVAAIAEADGLLGAEHPEALRMRLMRATTSLRDHATALAVLEPTCERMARHAGLGAQAARCWAEAAFLRAEVGAPGLEAADRAAALSPEPMSDLEPYRPLWRGDADVARQAFEAALQAVPAGGQKAHRSRPAELRLGLGRAELAAGKLSAARTNLAAAIEELSAIAAVYPSVKVDRRLGRARIELARVLSRLGASPQDIRPIASAALDWLRLAGGRADEITAMERLAR